MFIKNKYRDEYFDIIKNSVHTIKLPKNHIDYIYLENHHIIPRSLGGDNSKDNLVLLTAQDHYRCHELLPRFTVGKDKNKMLCAWNYMSMIGERKVDEELYATLKMEYSIVKSKGMSGELNPKFKGFYLTPFGLLTSSREVYNFNSLIAHDSVQVWCQNPDRLISKGSYRQSKYLQSLGENVIGLTFKDIGFDFQVV